MSDDQHEDKDQTINALRADLSALRDNEVKMRKRIKELETSSSSHEEAVARARAEGAAEREQSLLASHHRALNEAEIRARAARLFNDPTDAIRFLDLDRLGASQGRIEAERLDEAMSAVLEAKPYLKASAGAPAPAAPPPSGENGAPAEQNRERPTGDGGGGPRPPGHASPDLRMNEAIRKAVGRR